MAFVVWLSGYRNALYGFFVEPGCGNVCRMDEKRIQDGYNDFVAYFKKYAILYKSFNPISNLINI